MRLEGRSLSRASREFARRRLRAQLHRGGWISTFWSEWWPFSWSFWKAVAKSSVNLVLSLA